MGRGLSAVHFMQGMAFLQSTCLGRSLFRSQILFGPVKRLVYLIHTFQFHTFQHQTINNSLKMIKIHKWFNQIFTTADTCLITVQIQQPYKQSRTYTLAPHMISKTAVCISMILLIFCHSSNLHTYDLPYSNVGTQKRVLGIAIKAKHCKIKGK